MTAKLPSFRFHTALTAMVFLMIGLAQAGGRPSFKWTPNRDITISAVSNVLIEPDKITITAKASEPDNPKAGVTDQKISLIINRPPLEFNNAHLKQLLDSTRRGDFAKSLDRKQFKNHREKLWKSSLAAAKTFQKGNHTGTVAYFKPKGKKHEGKIPSLDGYGFLFVKTK